MSEINNDIDELDEFTTELIQELYSRPQLTDKDKKVSAVPGTEVAAIRTLAESARSSEMTEPILDLFRRLKKIKNDTGSCPDDFGISAADLANIAKRHRDIDEHGVTVGGRLNRANMIVQEADQRVKAYMHRKDIDAPSGIQIWDRILENQDRIKSLIGIDDETWQSYSGQIRNCIDSVDLLSRIIGLPEDTIADIIRVTRSYRMRLTPYYASLIQPDRENDPVLLQSVPTGEMVDNVGVEIPPVAADHSPARLIDQFYPRTLTIKVTNMCAMYCTHCLRIAHIGKRDRIYPDAAYEEALDYIRKNEMIRDVLITGGDAFVLPNAIIRKILSALDDIDHVKLKRLGTRIPVTAPWRVDDELLDILALSNDKKPVRVVTQINTAQEMTPVSANAFKKISKAVSAVLNQAVLLKGINDTYIKIWKLCETIQENYVRPYYIFNCSYRNPQFSHFRVPVEHGRDIVESMYGNISGDAIPRYIATAGGKIPLHRSNVVGRKGNTAILRKPWSGEQVEYPDAQEDEYENPVFAFSKYTQRSGKCK